MKLSIKFQMSIFFLCTLAFIIIVEIIGQIFFINRTESMPRGIYLKQSHKHFKTGNTIVFNSEVFKGNLIKYIAAIFPSEFCIDEDASLWIDGIPVAQINIEKYPAKAPTESQCQQLKSDEIFVLGDHHDSYDSRYFGPIKKNQVIAQVELLWQFK